MPKQGAELVRTNVFLSAAERNGFKRLARRQNISAAALIRRVLDAFLGIQPEPVEAVEFKYDPERAAKEAAPAK